MGKVIMHYKGYSAVCEYRPDGHVVATVPEFPGAFAIVVASVDDAKEVFKRYAKLDRKRREKAALQSGNGS